MSGSIRPLDPFGGAATFSICVVWGFNQVIVKAALAEVGPMAQSGIRSAIGCVCVIAYAMLTKRPILRIDGTEAAGAVAGFLCALEFIVLFESLRWTTAARSIVFLYAAPFFVALGAALVLTDERPRPIHWLGLAVAFLGFAVGLVGPGQSGGVIGDGLAGPPPAALAATPALVKAPRLRRAPPLQTPACPRGSPSL